MTRRISRGDKLSFCARYRKKVVTYPAAAGVALIGAPPDPGDKEQPVAVG